MDNDVIEHDQHYAMVAQAIDYIRAHALQQPSLEQIAQHVGLSESYFQRVFAQWAGVSPKRFLLILLGWAIFLGNLISLLLLPTFVLYMNRYQIFPEERALQEKFGQAYIAYKQRVRRWL